MFATESPLFELSQEYRVQDQKDADLTAPKRQHSLKLLPVPEFKNSASKKVMGLRLVPII